MVQIVIGAFLLVRGSAFAADKPIKEPKGTKGDTQGFSDPNKEKKSKKSKKATGDDKADTKVN
jgi:hypothetical protein